QCCIGCMFFFFFQAEDGIRYFHVTGVQTCALPIFGKGTGLGLSQVFGFVRQAGGTARIESSLGRGTRVCLLLPVAKGEAAQTVRSEERRVGKEGRAGMGPTQSKEQAEIILSAESSR